MMFSEKIVAELNYDKGSVAMKKRQNRNFFNRRKGRLTLSVFFLCTPLLFGDLLSASHSPKTVSVPHSTNQSKISRVLKDFQNHMLIDPSDDSQWKLFDLYRRMSLQATTSYPNTGSRGRLIDFLQKHPTAFAEINLFPSVEVSYQLPTEGGIEGEVPADVKEEFIGVQKSADSYIAEIKKMRAIAQNFGANQGNWYKSLGVIDEVERKYRTELEAAKQVSRKNHKKLHAKLAKQEFEHALQSLGYTLDQLPSKQKAWTKEEWSSFVEKLLVSGKPAAIQFAVDIIHAISLEMALFESVLRYKPTASKIEAIDSQLASRDLMSQSVSGLSFAGLVEKHNLSFPRGSSSLEQGQDLQAQYQRLVARHPKLNVEKKAEPPTEQHKAFTLRQLSKLEAPFRGCLGGDCSTRSYFETALSTNYAYFTLNYGLFSTGAITIVYGECRQNLHSDFFKCAFLDKIQSIDDDRLYAALAALSKTLETKKVKLVVPIDLGGTNGITNDCFYTTRDRLKQYQDFASQQGDAKVSSFNPAQSVFAEPTGYSRAFHQLESILVRHDWLQQLPSSPNFGLKLGKIPRPFVSLPSPLTTAEDFEAELLSYVDSSHERERMLFMTTVLRSEDGPSSLMKREELFQVINKWLSDANFSKKFRIEVYKEVLSEIPRVIEGDQVLDSKLIDLAWGAELQKPSSEMINSVLAERNGFKILTHLFEHLSPGNFKKLSGLVFPDNSPESLYRLAKTAKIVDPQYRSGFLLQLLELESHQKNPSNFQDFVAKVDGVLAMIPEERRGAFLVTFIKDPATFLMSYVKGAMLRSVIARSAQSAQFLAPLLKEARGDLGPFWSSLLKYALPEIVVINQAETFDRHESKLFTLLKHLFNHNFRKKSAYSSLTPELSVDALMASARKQGLPALLVSGLEDVFGVLKTADSIFSKNERYIVGEMDRFVSVSQQKKFKLMTGDYSQYLFDRDRMVFVHKGYLLDLLGSSSPALFKEIDPQGLLPVWFVKKVLQDPTMDSSHIRNVLSRAIDLVNDDNKISSFNSLLG